MQNLVYSKTSDNTTTSGSEENSVFVGWSHYRVETLSTTVPGKAVCEYEDLTTWWSKHTGGLYVLWQLKSGFFLNVLTGLTFWAQVLIMFKIWVTIKHTFRNTFLQK